VSGDSRAPGAGPREHSAPAPAPSAERNSKPQQERAVPQHEEAHGRPAERADISRHDEHRAVPEKAAGPPPKDDQGDHPR
jgi:hypothetical protein